MPATMNRATIAITPGSHIFKEVVFGMVLAVVWESRGLPTLNLLAAGLWIRL